MLDGPTIKAMSYGIPESVHAQFPKSANRRKVVVNAWHPDKTTLTRPEPGGMDGWVPVSELATESLLRRLKEDGYTWVNLYAGGSATPYKDVPLSRLI